MRDQSESDDFSNVYDMRASQGAMFMLRVYGQGPQCRIWKGKHYLPLSDYVLTS